jgi:hypothetical protein
MNLTPALGHLTLKESEMLHQRTYRAYWITMSHYHFAGEALSAMVCLQQ